jgi:hypothetical protein
MTPTSRRRAPPEHLLMPEPYNLVELKGGRQLEVSSQKAKRSPSDGHASGGVGRRRTATSSGKRPAVKRSDAISARRT